MGEAGRGFRSLSTSRGWNFIMVKKWRDFRELRVWNKAMDLAVEIRKVVKGFPKEEIYGLVSQIKRSSSSVYANIAEGSLKRTSKDFVKYLYNAMGSIAETQSHLIFSGRIGYVDREELKRLEGDYDELTKMLGRFIDYISGEDIK